MDDVKYISNLISGEDIYYLKDAEARTNLADKISKEEYAEGVVVDSTRYYTVTGAEKEYWNSKVNPPSYSAPTAKNLTYTGEAQTLLNAGSSTVGTIQYSEDETNWSTSIPTGTNAGTYTVYWRFIGSEVTYVDSTEIEVVIAKATPVYSAPTAKSGLVYNTSAQDLINAGTTSGGTILYSEDNENWSSSVPSKTNAGDYVVYWKLDGGTNYESVAASSFNISIAKVTPTVTAPTAKTGLVYNGTAQDLVNAGSTDWGTLQYSLGNETYSTSIPSSTNAGDYTVYYKVVGDSNINGVAALSVNMSVAKINRNVMFADVNGHEYIDLGLPSGTLWATMNVGANAPEAYGNFYMYGKGSSTYNSYDSAYTGTEDPLATSADTASQVWGGSWYMITQTQLRELTSNTTYEWTTVNGVNGGKFTASNGNYIFFPAAGRWDNGSYTDENSCCYVWTSSPYSSNAAYYGKFNQNKYMYSGNSTYGLSVRAVAPPSYKTTLRFGETNTIEVFTEGSPTITVTSSNTSVATVSGMTVTAVDKGTTTITITVAGDSNYNEYTYSYTLNVTLNGVYAAYADGSIRTAANADTNAIGVAVITDNCKFIIDKINNTNASWDSQYSTNGVIAGCFATNNTNTAKTNYTGVSNTNAIAAVASGGEAAKYCRSCSKTIAGKTVYGYLGACGEWQTAYDNKSIVDSIMSTIGGTAISSGYYWTSSLCLSSDYAWRSRWVDGKVDNIHKLGAGPYVRPLYEIS